MRQNLAEMGLAMDPNKAVPLRKRKVLARRPAAVSRVSERPPVASAAFTGRRRVPFPPASPSLPAHTGPGVELLHLLFFL